MALLALGLHPLGLPTSGHHAMLPALVRRAARAWPAGRCVASGRVARAAHGLASLRCSRSMAASRRHARGLPSPCHPCLTAMPSSRDVPLGKYWGEREAHAKGTSG